MKNIYKKRTWTQLKELLASNGFELNYVEKKNRFKVIIVIGDTTFFTNLYKPNSKVPRSLDLTQNSLDFIDFKDNHVTSIDDSPPKNQTHVKIDTGLPISDLDGVKLAVHTSSKPTVDGVTTSAVWTGSGDHPTTGMICDGDLLDFSLTTGLPEKSVDVKFNQIMNGRIWINEGYLKFEGGGVGDYMNGDIVAEPTTLQQVANLDLLVDGNGWITYSSGGPGTGTHGFADAQQVVPIPKHFSKDGEWDWIDGNLTPNFTNTGEYKLSINELIIHRYINKIPCRGTCSTYFSMSSNDTAEILNNYFLRITAYNVSDTDWFANVIMEIYRERTYNP